MIETQTMYGHRGGVRRCSETRRHSTCENRYLYLSGRHKHACCRNAVNRGIFRTIKSNFVPLGTKWVSSAEGIWISGRPQETGLERRYPVWVSQAAQNSPAKTVSIESDVKGGSGAPEPPKKKVYPVDKECLQVTEDITLLRATCRERLPEIQFGQKKGTTTNSYLVKARSPITPNKDTILIDVPSSAYDYDVAGWLEELGVLERISTVVVTRLNPERIPSLVALLQNAEKRNEKLTVYMSKLALQLLEERCDGDPDLKQLVSDRAILQPVTRGTTISLGGGETLKFFPIPTPRWPDLIAAYSTADRVLFSSSFFAAHEAAEAGSSAFDDSGWDAYGSSWRYYFDCMLAPAARQVLLSLDRLKINGVDPKVSAGAAEAFLRPLRSVLNVVTELTMGADDGVPEPLAVSYICPIHGPVIKSNVTQLYRKYREWTDEQIKLVDTSSVAVLYASAYGNTASLAQAISRGITKGGVGVETLNLEVVGADEVEKAIERSAGFIIGSPTLGGHMPTQVQTALGTVMRAGSSKKIPCGVFGSFGWSGEAVDMMEAKLKDAGFPFAFPSIRCKFKPTESMLQICEQSGTDLAQRIKKDTRIRERNAAVKLAASETASGPVLATGRIIGSLCVLTATDGDAKGAMLASWVSQASFNPPGLTVAVKKDRAIESLLPVGSNFVLNILAEGKDKKIMKEMVKQFAPGEDRFQNVDVTVSEKSGAMIFDDAAAYVECTVNQRMEAGDHWVVYATVSDGKVLDDGAQSAVHFRKVGSYY